MYFCYCKWIWMNIAYLWDQDCGNIDWSDEINIYQALRTNFVRNIKQQMFSLLLKLKTNMLIINQFICKYKSHGMVTRRSRRWPLDVPQRHCFFQCYSLYFITLLARYTEVRYHLKQSFLLTWISYFDILCIIYIL